jgi:oxygen-dependent protoporphyrinogen oxidase
VFLAPRDGTAALAAAVAARVAATADVRLATPVHALEPMGAGWSVDGEQFDAVVLAVPAWVAAPLLDPIAPAASSTLAQAPYSSVAMLTLVVDRRAFAPGAAPAGSGVLVPKPQQRHVTAVSFGSQKWAHWQVPGREVLRVSVGRDGDEHALEYDDATLTRAVLADLVDIVGLRGDPEEMRITRWPRSFPQYRPGHLDRIATAEADVARATPGVALAGAALRGLGIPACIGSGQRAAATVAAHLGVAL